MFIYFRRGRKSSRSGSKTGSRTSSADRESQDLGSDLENEENSLLRTSSMGSRDDDDDAKSDSSFANRLGLKKKKKPAKVNLADFDELFARGMARSDQAGVENFINPSSSPNKASDADAATYGLAGSSRYDEKGARFTPFEVYSHEEAFRQTQKSEGIGYAEKVLSYLDDQAHTPRQSIWRKNFRGFLCQ